MLNLAKSSPTALYSKARTHLEKRQAAEAQLYATELLRRDINDPEALSLLAETYGQQGMKMDAFSFYTLAVCAAPDVLKYKEKFVNAAHTISMEHYNESAERAIFACLQSAHDLEYTKLRAVWATHLHIIPEMIETYDLINRKPYAPETAAFFNSITNLKPLVKPYFLMGIKRFVLYSPVFEDFIASIRKHLLNDVGIYNKLTADEFLKLACAISSYSLNTDYILDVTPEEDKRVEELRQRVEGGELDAASIAVLAAYMPLFKLKNSEIIGKTFAAHEDLRDIVIKQIEEYQILHETAKTIEAITPIDHAVSLEVQKQYEEFPYPRWDALPDPSLLNGWKMTPEEQKIIGDRLSKKNTKILIAGCGTGIETVVYAVTFPNAQILAIDLSRSSLAYAMNKVKQYGLKNVTFRQADILNLGVLEEKFDCVISGGVLHHIHDPVKAWGILCGLMKDDALMLVGFYSKIARSSLLKAQKIVQEKKKGHDAPSMRHFRKNSPEILGLNLISHISHFADYYYLNMYRDMLFHVQEQDYDLPELAAILKKLKLKFVRFQTLPVTSPEQMKEFPQDLTDLEGWNKYEVAHPEAFAAMYVFWCKKDI